MSKKYIILVVAVFAAVAMFAAPKTKKKAPTADELAERAEEALMMYNTDALSEALDEWDDLLTSGRKRQPEPKRLEELKRRSIALENMLQRVEKIVVVDSLSVDTADFFKFYRMSADAGRIGSNASGGLGGPAAANGAVLSWYMPARATEMYYTALDSAGQLAIMVADILDDNTRDTPRNIRLRITPDSNEAYPFLMADGMTLYFASDADTEASLGGYDIYRTSKTDNGFYEPTNIGMPYNSPANDYMLAIDETTGLGWWATDRNAEDGKVTIYVFRPNETRVNYDPDTEGLSDLAFLTDYRATQPEGFDAGAFMARINEQTTADPATATSFALSLGNGKVFHTLDQLPNARARTLMQEYLKAEKYEQALQTRLADLRSRFGAGDKSVSAEILKIEAETPAMRAKLTGMRNAVIRACR